MDTMNSAPKQLIWWLTLLLLDLRECRRAAGKKGFRNNPKPNGMAALVHNLIDSYTCDTGIFETGFESMRSVTPSS